jgi:hypothetical protein
LIDWQEASQRPLSTLTFLFAGGAVGAGLVTYFIGTARSLSGSLAVGLACGLVCLTLGWRSIRDPAGVVARATKASKRMLVSCAVAALALALVGAALSDWQLAASAVPLAIVAAALLANRRSL